MKFVVIIKPLVCSVIEGFIYHHFPAGIQGFARLCQGDVFEVTLKHGTQKWKSRGRVCKDNTQTWDNQRTVIKGLIGEMVMSPSLGFMHLLSLFQLRNSRHILVFTTPHSMRN